jgi:hypothetical protein
MTTIRDIYAHVKKAKELHSQVHYPSQERNEMGINANRPLLLANLVPPVAHNLELVNLSSTTMRRALEPRTSDLKCRWERHRPGNTHRQYIIHLTTTTNGLPLSECRRRLSRNLRSMYKSGYRHLRKSHRKRVEWFTPKELAEGSPGQLVNRLCCAAANA